MLTGLRTRLGIWLEPFIDAVDSRLQSWQDASARIVRVDCSDAPSYYLVEVKSFGKWIPRVLSVTPDLAEADRWWRREVGREPWPTRTKTTVHQTPE
jgi:hypothetical protein